MDSLNLIDFSRYIISEKGTIWSKHYKRCLGSKYPNGYYRVNLTLIDGSKKDFLLHRVIAFIYCSIPDEFKEIPLENLEVDHIIPISDGGTNEASNLRWVDSAGNSRNEITLRKNKESQSKKPVAAYKKDTGEFVGEYESTNDASRKLSINQGNIYNCASGRCKSYKGYTFKFV